MISQLRMGWLVLAGCVAFVPFVYFLPRMLAFEMMNALICAIGVGIVVGFSRSFLIRIRSQIGQYDGGDTLLTGVWILWVGLPIVFIFLWSYRELGYDIDLRDHIVGLFGRWLVMIGGIYHLAASGAIDGKVPPRSLMRVGMWVAAGLAILAVSIVVFHRSPF